MKNSVRMEIIFIIFLITVGFLFITSTNVFAIRPFNMVELGTTLINPGDDADVVKITTTAANGGVFTVPADKVFVIKSVGIYPQNPGAGDIYLWLVQNNAIREYWIVPNDHPTQIQLPDNTGIVIASNYTLSIKNGNSSAGAIRVDIFGYISRP